MELSLKPGQLHQAYDSLVSGVLLVDTGFEENVLFINRTALDYYECSTEQEFDEFTGGRFSGMTMDTDTHLSGVNITSQYGYLRFQFRTRKKRIREAEGYVSKITTAEGRQVYMLQLFYLENKLENASYDELTGLPGTQNFYHKALELAGKKKMAGDFTMFCPAFINIANFRGYNRSHGSEAGDKMLRYVAEILKSEFPEALIGHFSADNFAAILPRKNIFELLDEVCSSVDRRLGHGGASLKIGIVVYDKIVGPDVIMHSFDNARLACASIKNDKQKSWAIYDDKMKDTVEKRQYILDNFDDALSSGYIKVFYQPVVRTLSGKVCSYEALARWDDPKHGMISPGVFVPVLEDARLIGRLDVYVIESVIRSIHSRLEAGGEILPVSVNLSRLDFTLIDPVKCIEDAIIRYDVPRKFIHVEITETALAQNKEILEHTIGEFHSKGYEVWLDDFGSEYSSLNALHNFNFDLLKIDMGFFSNFNERGKEIITSVIYMAKCIGMHTLAEGVETREQLEFLKSMGCERIQGYYYGRPMQFEVGLIDAAKRHLTFEKEKEASMWEMAGFVNMTTDSPVAIFVCNGHYPQILMANKAYKNFVINQGYKSIANLNHLMKDDSYRLNIQLRRFINEVYESSEKSVVYASNGTYNRLNAKKIAGNADYWIGQTSAFDISMDEDRNVNRRMDMLAKQSGLFVDGFFYIDFDEDKIEAIVASSLWAKTGDVYNGIKMVVDNFCNSRVHPDDRQRFYNYIDREKIRANAAQSERGIAEDLFRIKLNSGRYCWIVFRAVIVNVDGSEKVIMCEQEDIWEHYENRAGMLPVFASSLSVAVRTDFADSKNRQKTAEKDQKDRINRLFTAHSIKEIAAAKGADTSQSDALLGFEAWTNDVITMGLDEKDPSEGIQKTILKIAENLHSERFFIFEELDENSVSCTYEWARNGQVHLKDELQAVPKKDLAALYNIFKNHKVAVITDYDKFTQENPGFMIPVSGIENVISGQLMASGTPIGFTMVLNSRSPEFEANGYMLATLTNFIAALIRNSKMLHDAEEKSMHDPMTGALNRSGLERYVRERTSGGSLTAIVVEVYKLHEINVKQGYDGGDAVIKLLVHILMRLSDSRHVVRIDGDEFLILEEDIDELGVGQITDRIQNACLAEGIRIVTGYGRYNENAGDNALDRLITDAENEKYRNRDIMEQLSGNNH